MRKKKRFGFIAASAVAAGLIIAPATAATADTAIILKGSYSDCKATQNSYVSSWTKITRSCYYAGEGFWAFHYRSVGS